MAQHFDHSSDDGPRRAQRMTADESRAVIDLWQQERVEQTGLTDKPAVPDVAEGLDITVENVQRLLQDVRAKRLEEERALAAEQELSEIRLAEEERKLAEIQRQRAEFGREQQMLARRAAPIASRPNPLRRAPVPRQVRPNPGGLFYKTCGIVLFIWFALCLYHMVATALP